MAELLNSKKLENEGKAAYARGEYAEAARAFQAAAQGFAATGETISTAEMANNCSVAFLKAGDPQAALEAVDGTAAIFAAAGDVRRQGLAFGNQGAALCALGRLPEAAEYYSLSAELLTKAGDGDSYTRVMQALSAIQLRSGNQLQALATMQAGLEEVNRPTPTQRLLKRLLQIPFRLMDR